MDFPVYFRAEYNGDGIQRQWNASTNLLYINICANTLKKQGRIFYPMEYKTLAVANRAKPDGD